MGHFEGTHPLLSLSFIVSHSPWLSLSLPAFLSSTVARAHLWVDAWGVLNFVTLARTAANDAERAAALNAAEALIEAVHTVLGPGAVPNRVAYWKVRTKVVR